MAMDRNDRQAIVSLFERLAEAERQSPQRDPEAEAFIRQVIAAHPAAAYYLAQTVVAQQQALAAAEQRLAELESRAGSAGFADRGRRSPFDRGPAASERAQPAQPWGSPASGFLAGAAQTAMGVAGGVLLGNLLAGSLFGGFGAHAHDHAAGNDANDNDAGSGDAGNDNGGGFDSGGGDFSGDV
jgi:hypothetical protein